MWTAIDRLSIMWKSDVSVKIKWDILKAVAVSALLYDWTNWTPTKHFEKRLEWKHNRMLFVVLKKIWLWLPTKGPPISQTIQVN